MILYFFKEEEIEVEKLQTKEVASKLGLNFTFDLPNRPKDERLEILNQDLNTLLQDGKSKVCQF